MSDHREELPAAALPAQALPSAARVLQQALAGQYDLERELGRGGMATVYLARDRKHDRPVALKVLHADLGVALGPERFRREITTAARLQHPHVLTVHDSGDTAGRLWFTMPFVDGESLRDRLTREGQLPVPEAVRIAREAALGLHYAHTHGIVHRDVKPENILLTDDGTTLVADFGIARALQGDDTGEAGDTRLTGTSAETVRERARHLLRLCHTRREQRGIGLGHQRVAALAASDLPKPPLRCAAEHDHAGVVEDSHGLAREALVGKDARTLVRDHLAWALAQTTSRHMPRTKSGPPVLDEFRNAVERIRDL